MPNPPTPIEVKRRRGTLRRDRMPTGVTPHNVGKVAPADRDTVCEAPDVVLDVMLDGGVTWLAASDLIVTTMLRETVAERAALRDLIRAGWSASLAADLRAIDAQLGRMMDVAGLTPTSRSRLGLAEVTAAERLDRLRR